LTVGPKANTVESLLRDVALPTRRSVRRTLHNLSDSKLLVRAARDADAFDVIFVRHAPDIERWLRPRCGDAAPDLTAEVFARAFLARKRFDASKAPTAGPWLQGFAKNLLYEWERDNRLELRALRRLGVSGELTVDEDEAIERIDAEQLAPGALARLNELPADQRKAITMRVVDGMDYHDIAGQLRCTEVVVRMRVMRGLRFINERMGGGKR
jgi:RNA polymerase sigma factor (sigma-70 family)